MLKIKKRLQVKKGFWDPPKEGRFQELLTPRPQEEFFYSLNPWIDDNVEIDSIVEYDVREKKWKVFPREKQLIQEEPLKKYKVALEIPIEAKNIEEAVEKFKKAVHSEDWFYYIDYKILFDSSGENDPKEINFIKDILEAEIA